MAVAHHRHSVKLFEGRHGFQHQHDKTSTFDSFDRSSKKVGCYSLEVLEDTHAVCVAQDFSGVFIVSTGSRLLDDEFKQVY